MKSRRLYVDQRDVDVWINSRELHVAIAVLAIFYALAAALVLVRSVSELLGSIKIGALWNPSLFDALACATIAGLYLKSLANRGRAEGMGYALVGSSLGAVYLAVYVTVGLAELAMRRSLVESLRPEVLLGLGSTAVLWTLANRLFK